MHLRDFGGERTGLMKGEAVLNCLSVSLNYSSWHSDDGTTYAMAVGLGICRMDSRALSDHKRHLHSEHVLL